MTTKATLRQAIGAWPEGIPMRAVQVSDTNQPQAKSWERTTKAQGDSLRAAGWESSSAGWWTFRGTT